MVLSTITPTPVPSPGSSGPSGSPPSTTPASCPISRSLSGQLLASPQTTSPSSSSSSAAPYKPTPQASSSSSTTTPSAFASTSSASPRTKSTPSSSLSLTYSAHTSIPESLCLNPRLVHPFSLLPQRNTYSYQYPYLQPYPVVVQQQSKGKERERSVLGLRPDNISSSSRHYFRSQPEDETHNGSSSKGNGNLNGNLNLEFDEDPDGWFVDTFATGEDTSSLLIFRERQRKRFLVKQARERERTRERLRTLRREDQEAEAEIIRVLDREKELEKERKEELRKKNEHERQYTDKKRKADKITNDHETKKRKMAHPLEHDEVVMEDVFGSTGGNARPTSSSSTSLLAVSGSTSSRSRGTTPTGEPHVPLFRGSGGIGQGSGRAAGSPWVPHDEVSTASAEHSHLNPPPPAVVVRSSTPGTVVTKLVKTTSATAGATSSGKRRGLWSARGSGPVPPVKETTPTTSVWGEEKTQIGGFAFRNEFLSSTGPYQRQHLGATKASSPSLGGRQHEHGHRRVDSIEDEPSSEGVKRRRPRPHSVQGRSRSRSSSCSSVSSHSSSGSSSCSESSDLEDARDRPVSAGASGSSSSAASLARPRGAGEKERNEATTAPAKSLSFSVFGAGGDSSSSGLLGNIAVASSAVFPSDERDNGPANGAQAHDEGDQEQEQKRQRQLSTSSSTHHSKRRRTNSGIRPAASASISTPSPHAPRPKLPRGSSFSSSLIQRSSMEHESHGTMDVEESPNQPASPKYITRSKVMDTSSLATADPSVMESRKRQAVASQKRVADAGTSSDDLASVRSVTPPPRPQLPVENPVSVTYEDWEDLKEVWHRCLEVVDVEEPEDVLPLLRGIIHECSRFLQSQEDISALILNGKPMSADPELLNAGVGTSAESDVEMAPHGSASTSTTPSAAATPKATTPSPQSSIPDPPHPSRAHSHSNLSDHTNHYHHSSCPHYRPPGADDLPTAFHSLLGRALYLFGNLIDANPELALEGEPRTSTVYHLYALDVFEVGENLPARTGVGSPVTKEFTSTATCCSCCPSSSSVIASTSSVNISGALSSSLQPGSAQNATKGLNMKEDWQMAITWGRTIVSLAEDLLERQEIVEEKQKESFSQDSASSVSGFSYPYLSLGPSEENPAAFLAEDFGVWNQGYFRGTGGVGMGLSLDGAGGLTSAGLSLGAFYERGPPPPPAQRRVSSTPPQPRPVPSVVDDYWAAGVHKSRSEVTTPYAGGMGPASMYPSSSFLSPSFIAASSKREAAAKSAASSSSSSTYGALSHTTGSSSTITSATSMLPSLPARPGFSRGTTATSFNLSGGVPTPGQHHVDDPRKLWTEHSPFVVIRSVMPPITRRMSLGVGGGASVDDLMTLAIDQFSRGIFHMPRSGGVEGAAEDVEEKRHGRKRHRHHHHHHHRSSHRHSSHRAQGNDDGEGGGGGGSGAGGDTGDGAEEQDLPPFFSRASHLYTIAVQVLLLAEKMSDPGSRYRWGRYADSVFGQMRLEENPGPVVVTLARQRGGAGFWGSSPHATEEERMDVDVDMDDGEDDAMKKEHGKHHKKHGRHHHHKHKHSKHHSGAEASSSHAGSSSSVALVHRPPTVHPSLFLNHNTNPEVLKMRGRCGLVIGGARVEEGVEALLEEALGVLEEVTAEASMHEGHDSDFEQRKESAEKGVRDVLESEDAEEARERLEEAAKLLEKAREVWRNELWGPQKKARDSARKKKQRDQERLLREMEEKRKQVESGGRDEKGSGSTTEKVGRVKRRGIGKIAADNKRAVRGVAATPRSPKPPSSSRKGKEREHAPYPETSAVVSTLPSGMDTPAIEKDAEAALGLMSPGLEIPPDSSPSDAESRSRSGSRGSNTAVAPTSGFSGPDYFSARDYAAAGGEEEVDSEEQTFRAEEEEAEMEEKDLAQLLAEAYATLGELALTEEGKKEYSKKAREEARRAGKIELVEDDLGDEEEMNVD